MRRDQTPAMPSRAHHFHRPRLMESARRGFCPPPIQKRDFRGVFVTAFPGHIISRNHHIRVSTHARETAGRSSKLGSSLSPVRPYGGDMDLLNKAGVHRAEDRDIRLPAQRTPAAHRRRAPSPTMQESALAAWFSRSIAAPGFRHLASFIDAHRIDAQLAREVAQAWRFLRG